MRVLFDFRFGKLPSLVMQKLPSQFFKADSLCVHITSRAGPSRLHAEELGLWGTY